MRIAGVAVMDGAGGAGRPESGASVIERVYGHLRDLLVSGRIAPGARVNLVSVCRELHVSNTPVRRALARLAAEGYVTRKPNSGFFASPLLDTRAIVELYDFRLLVEPTAAGRAARKVSPEQLAQLSAVPVPNRDHDFHVTIAELAGNRLVTKNLATTFDTLGHLTRCGASELDVARDEHRAIVAALAAADAGRAAAAMHAHLINSRERLRTLFA